MSNATVVLGKNTKITTNLKWIFQTTSVSNVIWNIGINIIHTVILSNAKLRRNDALAHRALYTTEF